MTNIINPFPSRGPVRPEPALPSLARQAASVTMAFGRTVAQAVCDRPILAPKEVQAERWSVCEKCDKFRPSDKRCSLCGCRTSGWLVNKIMLSTEQCPDHPPKWLKWEPTIENENFN